MTETIITVTKKGQATIPKEMRERHGIARKVLVVDTKEGILFKPPSDPRSEKGSLKGFFKGKTSRQIIKEAREVEVRKDKKFEHRD